jgi:hypothetical protein
MKPFSVSGIRPKAFGLVRRIFTYRNNKDAKEWSTDELLDPVIAAAVLVAIGLGAGTLGSMLGVGGGVMMVPALTSLGIAPTQTASTSLIAVSSTGVSSTIEYARQRRIDYRLGMVMAAIAVPGAIMGAMLSTNFSPDSFRLYFAILLALAGLYVLYKDSILRDRLERGPGPGRARYVAVAGTSLGAGIISSLFGVGGGIIFVPSMLLILGMGIHRAAATSQLALVITSVAGVIAHAALGHPDYFYAAALSAGAFAGAQIGARLSRSAKDVILRKILAAVLIVIAGRFIFEWFLSR